MNTPYLLDSSGETPKLKMRLIRITIVGTLNSVTINDGGRSAGEAAVSSVMHDRNS